MVPSLLLISEVLTSLNLTVDSDCMVSWIPIIIISKSKYLYFAEQTVKQYSLAIEPQLLLWGHVCDVVSIYLIYTLVGQNKYRCIQ